MHVQVEEWTEFIDLKLNFENVKIKVDVFATPTNSFTYVLATIYYPIKRISKIPHDIALRLRCIYYSDEKFNSLAIEYKNYLIAREYKPYTVNKHFVHVSSLCKEQARQKSTNRKSQVSKSIQGSTIQGFLTLIVS